MRKTILFPIIVISSLLVSGCISNPWKSDDCVPQIVEKIKVEKVTVPENLTKIPAYGHSINTKTATQRDVAKWVTETEQRMETMENQLRAIEVYSKSGDNSKTGGSK